MIRINIQDDIPGFIPRDNFQLSISLYRIIQELITNTIKHAEASEIDIVIKNEGNTFILEYSDNGKGFDAEKIQMHGLGTQNIQSRLLMINASHIIDTAEGKGFRFIIYLEHPYII
jgi:signal transduction histidine kinase